MSRTAEPGEQADSASEIETLDRKRLARRIGEVAALNGAFTLRSGASSSRYFDKYRFEADPVLLHQIARGLAELLPGRLDALAGVELGGIALVTMCSHITQRPARFVRKQEKGHGTERLIEGGPVGALRLGVIEDVVSTGEAAAQACGALQTAGAHIAGVVCVIDREEGAGERLARLGLGLKALFGAREIETDGWRAMLDGSR